MSNPPTPPQLPRPAVPIQQLEYTVPATYRRPGILTAAAIISITLGSLGILSGGMTTLFTSFGAAAMARAPRTAAVAPVTPPVASGPVAAEEDASAGETADSASGDEELTEDGMSRADRVRVLDALATLRPLSEIRRKHVEALLAKSGRKIIRLSGPALTSRSVTANVTDSGQYPSGTNKPSAGADYFIFGLGRVEVTDKHAVFHPSGVGESIRATAAELGSDDATADAGDASSAAAGPQTPGTLSEAQVRLILSTIEANAGTKLTAAQARTLRTHLRAPNQTFFTTATGPNAVPLAAQINSTSVNNGTLTFSTPAGYMTVDPNGAITGMATFNFATTGGGGGPNFAAVRRQFILTLVFAVLSLALAIFLVVAGIFVLRDSPSGRRLHLIYAYLKIPLALATLATYAWLFTTFFNSMAGAGPQPAWGVSMMFAFPAVLSLVYPVALLIVMHTRTVKEYYSMGAGR